MTIVIDHDTPKLIAERILTFMDMEGEPFILDSYNDPLAHIITERILLVTSMPDGWLGYHQAFFEAHKSDTAEWIVILLNKDPVTINQARLGFTTNGIRLHLFDCDPDTTDWEKLNEVICKLTRIRRNKVLLYSLRPECGKKTLAKLLSEELPEWTFETAEEDLSRDLLSETDASQIIIVGSLMKDFCVPLPEGVQPFYVLTMPDENVQTYLKRKVLPIELLDYIPPELKWTMEAADAHFFCVSPLYETWRQNGTDPVLDARFIMWDEFGLPLPHESYTQENIRSFISQFDQCNALAQALKS